MHIAQTHLTRSFTLPHPRIQCSTKKRCKRQKTFECSLVVCSASKFFVFIFVSLLFFFFFWKTNSSYYMFEWKKWNKKKLKNTKLLQLQGCILWAATENVVGCVVFECNSKIEIEMEILFFKSVIETMMKFLATNSIFNKWNQFNSSFYQSIFGDIIDGIVYIFQNRKKIHHTKLWEMDTQRTRCEFWKHWLF